MRTASSVFGIVLGSALTFVASSASAQCDQTSAIDQGVCAKNYAVMTGDSSYCELIEDSELDQQDCYAMLARLTGTTLCESIDDQFARDDCRNQGSLGVEERAQRDRAADYAAEERAVQQEQLQVLEDQLAAQEDAQAQLTAILERQATLIEDQTANQQRMVEAFAPEPQAPVETEGAAETEPEDQTEDQAEAVEQPEAEAVEQTEAEPAESGLTTEPAAPTTVIDQGEP